MAVASHSAILFDATTQRWLHFQHPTAILVATSQTEVLPLLTRVQQAVTRSGVYAAGFLSYEAAPAFDP
ncbi:MAG: aminodeoxychorismate synthase, component I, partial [Spirulinaceae cyanobacterium RM2_2_10]|nr:aminodeoxychorismate synthase, component I [Spirulinaceae cyanobacterium RM2_2_10]